jgi:sugar O-acyltransferase (sialic acid O-acetyltransferase NeuD family)
MLFGAGGHASVVLDALLQDRSRPDVVVVDDNIANAGRSLLGFAILCPQEDCLPVCSHFHVGIGDNRARARVFSERCRDESRAVTVAHPAASISSFADISGGCFIAAQSVIAPLTKLGRATIINHGAIVDHDCRIGNFCHIAPTSSLGGNVRIGDFVLVGAGANVLPGVKIGDGATIGAGAVVTRNVDSGAVITGVPAVMMKRS